MNHVISFIEIYCWDMRLIEVSSCSVLADVQ